MTKIKLKSVIEFLFWILLFVFALAYFNKSWNLSFYFIIGALLFFLLIVEIILNLEHRYKKRVKKKKEIKKEQLKQNKKIFLKELTSLFSFIVVLIVVFSLIIQKNKFIEFLSVKPYHSYLMMITVVVALIILLINFVESIKSKKKFELMTRMKHDFIFFFGLIVVIVAYVFKNWITALLGLILMIISLVVYRLDNKKLMLIKGEDPKKIISKKIQKDQKLKLLLESPVGMLTKIKKEEERAKQETRMEKLKLKELQKKIREEEKRKKREEKLREKQEKLTTAAEIAKQKKVEAEKKKLEYLKKSRGEILKKEKNLGKIQKNREEIERIIKTRKGLKSKAKYETDFDRLLILINKYERLKISDVAKIFGISVKKAEAWGTILEQHNLVGIHYPAIGEPELRMKK